MSAITFLTEEQTPNYKQLFMWFAGLEAARRNFHVYQTSFSKKDLRYILMGDSAMERCARKQILVNKKMSIKKMGGTYRSIPGVTD